jgi:hypothetical protein
MRTLNRLGALIGNANDRRARHGAWTCKGTGWDSNRDAPWSYRVLDWLAHHLYLLGESRA